MVETANDVISTVGSSCAFLTINTNTDIAVANHGNIIRTITNSQGDVTSITGEADHLRLLLWTHSAANNGAAAVEDMFKLILVEVNDHINTLTVDHNAIGLHRTTLGIQLSLSLTRIGLRREL